MMRLPACAVVHQSLSIIALSLELYQSAAKTRCLDGIALYQGQEAGSCLEVYVWDVPSAMDCQILPLGLDDIHELHHRQMHSEGTVLNLTIVGPAAMSILDCGFDSSPTPHGQSTSLSTPQWDLLVRPCAMSSP